MFNLINYLINCFGMFDSILVVSFLCLSLSLVAYYYKYYPFSFFLLYVSLTSVYFFIILTENVSSISMAYYFYSISIFLCYYLFFTFSNRFYSRTIIVIKKYLKNSEYFKLILWIVLVFITALFGEVFIFLTVFNPLFAFSIVTANFMLFFYLFYGFGFLF